MYYKTLICTWNILDGSHKILLGNCLLIFGITGLTVNLWLCVALIRNQILHSRSYLLILAYCFGCIVRGILTVAFSSFSALLTKWLYDFSTCQLFGFLKLTTGIYQITLLSITAIERYLSVETNRIDQKPNQKDTELPFKFYVISTLFCWVFAIAISSFVVGGYGSFVYDTTCTVCELDWKYTRETQKVLNITVIVIAGVVPVSITCFFLYLATLKEKQFSKRKRYNYSDITKAVAIIIIITYIFWLPRAILITWIPHVKGKLPIALTIMAPLGAEASAIVPVLTHLVYLPGLRNALIVALGKRRQLV